MARPTAAIAALTCLLSVPALANGPSNVTSLEAPTATQNCGFVQFDEVKTATYAFPLTSLVNGTLVNPQGDKIWSLLLNAFYAFLACPTCPPIVAWARTTNGSMACGYPEITFVTVAQ